MCNRTTRFAAEMVGEDGLWGSSHVRRDWPRCEYKTSERCRMHKEAPSWFRIVPVPRSFYPQRPFGGATGTTPKSLWENVWAFGCVLGTVDSSLERMQFTMCV